MAAIIIVNFATFCARAAQVTGVASFAADFGNAAGRRLAHAGILGAEVFPRKGAADPSETGAVLALLNGLGPTVNWATAVFGGVTDMVSFCMLNQPLLVLIDKAMTTKHPPAGDGSTSADIVARQKASYAEVCQVVTTYATVFANFNDCVNLDDLTGADALLSDGSVFAKAMQRFCLYAATGVQGTVSAAEPNRTKLNVTLMKYENLKRTASVKSLLLVMPVGTLLAEPAIQSDSISIPWIH